MVFLLYFFLKKFENICSYLILGQKFLNIDFSIESYLPLIVKFNLEISHKLSRKIDLIKISEI
jgi:hypothetical protein